MTEQEVDSAEGCFPVRIGRCVYCGAMDDLSDEHVVPHGLGGKWLLLEASCPRCRDATSLVERRVLREQFIGARTVLDMPTRRKRERPTVLEQKLVAGDRHIALSLRPSDHPAPLAFPIFPPPTGRVDVTAASESFLTGIRVATRQGRLEALVATTGADKWTYPFAGAETFARFVAKVGYCFAVGSFGLDAIAEHYVRPFIVEGGVGIFSWVGCSPILADRTPDGGHHLSAVISDDVLSSEVQFFGIPGAPIYSVIVGRIHATAGESPAAEAY